MTETPTERNKRIFEEATAVGEPVFVIRAKDDLSPHAIQAYDRLARAALGDDYIGPFERAMEGLLGEFLVWRSRNAHQVKRPDVRS